MIEHFAFLRGINVGGKNKIAMETLRELMAGLGFQNSKTFLNTGNVAFQAQPADTAGLAATISRTIMESLGLRIAVCVVSKAELSALIGSDPFSAYDDAGDIERYLTFFCGVPAKKPELPLVSPKGDTEVFCAEESYALSIGYENGGRYGFPNEFIERKFGVEATTRNWKTVLKMIG